VHELIHAPGFFGRKVFLQLEILHRPAELAGELADIEACDRPDAADTVDHIGPGGLDGATHRRNDAHTRDDYSTLAQALLRPVFKWMVAGSTGGGAAEMRRAPVRSALRPWRAGR